MKKKVLFFLLILTCIYSIVSAGTIDGTVSGVVQEGITIELWSAACGSNELVATVTTAPNGDFSFTDVENGNYRVCGKITAYTFTPECIPVTVSDYSVSGIDFTVAPSRFIDNGDGTVTDTLTNLIWLQNANCVQTQDWDTAALFALGLDNGGCGLSDGSEYGDWRLPTKEELQGIGTNPLATWYIYVPSVTWAMPSKPFINGNSGYFYWSNTEYNTDYVWVLQMLSGYTNIYGKVGELYVWPVRSGKSFTGVVNGTSFKGNNNYTWWGPTSVVYDDGIIISAHDGNNLTAGNVINLEIDWNPDYGGTGVFADATIYYAEYDDSTVYDFMNPHLWLGLGRVAITNDDNGELSGNFISGSLSRINGLGPQVVEIEGVFSKIGIDPLWAECADGCPAGWIGDGWCDFACDVAACSNDAGDCITSCAPECYDVSLGDSWCDFACNVPACNYDDGDCTASCAPGCYDGWVGDGVCDAACDVVACSNDDGDC